MASNDKYSTKDYTITALFAGLIFLVTAYVLHIPTPATGGYIHLGDAFIYLAASILPEPFSALAAGIGASLSDIMTGCAIYALPTFIIKSVMTLCFSSKGPKIIIKRNILAMFAASAIDTCGYYLFEIILYHSYITPLASVPAHLVKDVVSIAVYFLIGRSFDRIGLKTRIKNQVSKKI